MRVCEGKAGDHQWLRRYLMMEKKPTYLKTDLHLPVVSQWRMSQRMNMDKNRIISSSAFDGHRQACKCRTRPPNKWLAALYFQPVIHANKPRGGKQAVNHSMSLSVTTAENFKSFTNALNPVLILHAPRVCQKRSCNTKGPWHGYDWHLPCGERSFQSSGTPVVKPKHHNPLCCTFYCTKF